MIMATSATAQIDFEDLIYRCNDNSMEPLTENREQIKKDYDVVLRNRKKYEDKLFEAISEHHTFITRINSVGFNNNLDMLENYRRLVEEATNLAHQLSTNNSPADRATLIIALKNMIKNVNIKLTEVQTEIIMIDDDFYSKYSEVISTSETYHSENESHITKVNHLLESLSVENTQVEAKTSSLFIPSLLVDDLNQRFNSFVTSLYSLNLKKNYFLEKRCGILESEVDNLKAETRKLTFDNAAIRAENILVRNKIESLLSDNLAFKAENAALKEDNATLKADNIVLHKRIDDQKKDFDKRFEDQKNGFEKRFEDQSKEISKLVTLVKSMTGTISPIYPHPVNTTTPTPANRTLNESSSSSNTAMTSSSSAGGVRLGKRSRNEEQSSVRNESHYNIPVSFLQNKKK